MLTAKGYAWQRATCIIDAVWMIDSVVHTQNAALHLNTSQSKRQVSRGIATPHQRESLLLKLRSLIG